MPRNVTPRCIIDPVQVVPLFAFTAAQREQIIGALPCVSGDQLEFIAGLERCARTFLWLRNQYRERPTLAEQNAALAEICQLSDNLARRLSCLDLDTEWNLDRAGLPTDSLAEVVDHMEFVTHAAEQALHWGKQKRGPRHDPYIDRIMPELAELYEQGTGKSFTNNPKQKKAFTWASRNRPRAATSCRFSKPSIHR